MCAVEGAKTVCVCVCVCVRVCCVTHRLSVHFSSLFGLNCASPLIMRPALFQEQNQSACSFSTTDSPRWLARHPTRKYWLRGLWYHVCVCARARVVCVRARVRECVFCFSCACVSISLMCICLLYLPHVHLFVVVHAGVCARAYV
jgi:hypothetical protein